MFRSLQLTDELEFQFNDITEIPENAFKPNNGSNTSLFDINLSHNQISKIGLNAFYGLDNLGDIQLQYNNLTTIDNCLNFPPNKYRRNIMLGNNQLTANSFNVSYLKSEENMFMSIFVENNKFTTFPENIFSKYFANGKNEISLDGNKFECDCSMKWILDNSTKLSKLIHDLYCANKYNKNIFSLNAEDLGCAEVNTSSTASPITTPKTTQVLIL
jgi:hypothetical protein